MEVLDEGVSGCCELSAIKLSRHQAPWCHRRIWVSRQIFARCLPFAINLLTKRQSPVKRRRVVVDELGVWYVLANFTDHRCDLCDVWLLGFDPEQICTVVEASDAIKNNAIKTGTFTEGVEPVIETNRLYQLAILVDRNIIFL